MKITEKDIIEYYSEKVLKGKIIYLRELGWDIYNNIIKTHPELLPVTNCELNENTTTLIYNKHGLEIKHGYDIIPYDEILPGCAITIEDDKGNTLINEDSSYNEIPYEQRRRL